MHNNPLMVAYPYTFKVARYSAVFHLPLYLQSCPLFCGIPLTLIPSKLPVILRYVTYPYTFKVARYSAVCHLHN
ncbi:hypothetical protein GLP21_17520 [Photobacterium carnosum]|uniref:hypothetical protein n=1 Tax=Photobacterium TaxID=657 RepID=UPI001E5368C0|nr:MULTISPECIES: hypothetical protein [Photobacterium]MCD9476324.1 hypothetical protein [Photobacterium phosphoreum]MCD9488079.1 hypothetical protein [Photobacterium iliopiscarium]MCD9508100.1 hypothetical protein [Photobacterium phosphoreum]MCD9542325.1 hypothetical protein [Photobacterium carnosum]MCD9546104.1 hypothetical protein [Photobacterium carnosum]